MNSNQEIPKEVIKRLEKAAHEYADASADLYDTTYTASSISYYAGAKYEYLLSAHTDNQSDPFLQWLDEDIHDGKNLLQSAKTDEERKHISSAVSTLHDVREKYLSLHTK